MMRHIKISKGNNDNLSTFKKQINNILQKINNFDEAEKSEALNYVRQFIDTDNSDVSNKSETENAVVDCDKNMEKVISTASNNKKNKVRCKKRRRSVIEKPRLQVGKVKVKPLLKCKVCDETKKTKISLLKHMEFHIGTPVTCLKCRRTFNSKTTFDWHKIHLCRKRKRVLTKRFKCSECPKEFRLQRHLNLHLEGHKRNNCSYCDTVLTRREHLVQHMLDKHKIKLEKPGFKCDHCDKWYVKRRSLYHHLQQHAPSKLICLECGNISNTEEEHSAHIKKHEEQKPWQCPKCKDRFSRRQQYFYHLKRHDRYKCLSCNESYASKARVYRHKQRGHMVQGLEPRLHCPHCPAAFHRTLLLQMHIRKHKEDETKINCKFCDKTFHTPYQYYKHCMTILHDKNSPEINQLVCENCGKQFTKKYVLEQHLQRFHGAKPGIFSCKYCPYSTQFRPNLARHMNLHFTVGKQFVCDHCGKSFSTIAILTDHINYIHIQEKQFQCNSCDKSFKRKSELVRHQSCHSDARPHGCQLCGQTYKRISHLRRHEETAHALVNKTNRVQRLKTDDTGAVIPIPMEKKKSMKNKNNNKQDNNKDAVYSLANNEPSEYLGVSVPVITSVTLPKNIEDNLINLDTSGFNQQFWTDKLNLQVDKDVPIAYNTDPSNLEQMPTFSEHGNDLQAFNIVDQLVNSLLPSKDLQIVDCQVYNDYSDAPLEYSNLHISGLNKSDDVLTATENNVTW